MAGMLAPGAPSGTGALAARSLEAADPPPNVVVFSIDDQPALDGRLTAFMPNVKAILADQGFTLTDFHVEYSLGSPGRVGFLTGQHAHNHGVTDNDVRLFGAQMTLATQLDAQGYYTAHVGRYLSNYSKIAPTVPPGWDRFSATDGSGIAYYDYRIWNDGNPTAEVHGSAPSDYSTDVIRGKAVSIVNGAPAEQPLFLWVSTNAIHPPYTPAPRHASSPCSVSPWSPPNYNEADLSDKPSFMQGIPLLTAAAADLVQSCRALLAVDEMVGAVRDALAAAGRLENTIFVYAGDNGFLRGEHRVDEGRILPYVTEVPAYLAWPAGLGSSPRTISEKLMNIDLAPTLCDLAGCTLGPYPNGQAGPDGVSFAPLLRGTATTVGRDAVLGEMLATRFDPVTPFYFVTTTELSSLGLWRYVEHTSGERELYDLFGGPCFAWQPGQPGDPCRLQSQAANPAYSNLIAALHDRLAQLKAEVGGPGGAAGNDAPGCYATSLETVEGTAAETRPLCIDQDLHESLGFEIVTQGAKGTASVVAGMLHYEPLPGQVGADSFTYRANDGEAVSNVATVSVTITPAGAPSCQDTSLTTTEGVAAETDPVCSDPDPGDVLTYSIVGQGTKGTASVTPLGRLRYEPAPGMIGTDSFTYRANDGGADSNVATVSVTIEPAAGTASVTLLPNGDGSRDTAITASGSTTLWGAIDDTIAAADDGKTYVKNKSKANGRYFALLTNMPADFRSMQSLTIDIRARLSNWVDGGGDAMTLYGQLFMADEVTPLSAEIVIARNPGTTSWETVAGVPVTGVVAGTKSDWDGARLRLRWQWLKGGAGGSTSLRLTAAEVHATYAR